MTNHSSPSSSQNSAAKNKGEKLDPKAHGVKAKQKKKKPLKKYFIIAGVLGFCYFMYWGLKPVQAHRIYGMCKTYVELSVPYPQTLKFSNLRIHRKRVVKMQYSYIDSYGQTLFFPIDCIFAKEGKGLYLKKVEANRDRDHPLDDPERVKLFNAAMGIGLFNTYKPDLTKPRKVPRDITKYRK